MDTELQEDLKIPLENLVNKFIKNNVFSACSVGVVDGRKGELSKDVFNYGFTDQFSGVRVDNKTVFDLASLTKPLVTTLCILALVKKGGVCLDDYLADYLEMTGEGTKDITICHLLEHTSGLRAHHEYFRLLIPFPKREREEMLFNKIKEEDLLIKPGREELYSDLGFMILGRLVEKITGERLSDFWQNDIIYPLGLGKSLFFEGKRKLSGTVFVSTGSCQWSNKELSGLVHDDNCRSIGGVSGHAGLFGTAEGVSALMEILLKMYEKSYSHPSFSFDAVRARLQENHGRWVLGFDTRTGTAPSSGKYFSKKTLGHLGFTGTSFWMDCSKKIGIVVLTNRVLCSADLTQIRIFRPAVHNLIMEKLTVG